MSDEEIEREYQTRKKELEYWLGHGYRRRKEEIEHGYRKQLDDLEKNYNANERELSSLIYEHMDGEKEV
jgi:hypothetical protein